MHLFFWNMCNPSPLTTQQCPASDMDLVFYWMVKQIKCYPAFFNKAHWIQLTTTFYNVVCIWAHQTVSCDLATSKQTKCQRSWMKCLKVVELFPTSFSMVRKQIQQVVSINVWKLLFTFFCLILWTIQIPLLCLTLDCLSDVCLQRDLIGCWMCHSYPFS